MGKQAQRLVEDFNVGTTVSVRVPPGPGSDTGTTTGTAAGESEPLRHFYDWKREDHPQGSPSHRRTEEEEVMDFTPKQIIEDGNEKKNYLVMLTAEWCHWCKKMYPLMKSLKADGYLVYVFDVDEPQNKDFPKKYKARAYPQFLIYENGKEKHRTAGATEEKWFVKRLVKQDNNPYDGIK